MTTCTLKVQFDRPYGEDAAVIGKEYPTARQFFEQLKAEIKQSCPLDIDLGAMAMDNYIGAVPTGDQYRIEATVPLAVPEGTSPAEALTVFLDGIQEAYDDGMSGFCDVTHVVVDGETHDAKDIAASRGPSM